MRSTRFIIVLLIAIVSVVFCQSFAGDAPRAFLEGYKCCVVSDGQAPSGPQTTIVLCQIEDDGGPVTGSIVREAPRSAVGAGLGPPRWHPPIIQSGCDGHRTTHECDLKILPSIP